MGDGAVTFDVDYNVNVDGIVRVSARFEPNRPDLPVLPRLGMQLIAPAKLSKLEWYGRGPQATYADRWAAAPVGRYSGTVAEQFHTYVRPQENSNKVDVRWMALRQPDGEGLVVVGDPTFSGGASDVLDEDMDYDPAHQLHSDEVERRGLTVIHVDLMQMGLGGDDSWRSTAHPEYLIWPKHYEYSFRLIPLHAGEDAGAIARR
jgi:beta-galactosidase